VGGSYGHARGARCWRVVDAPEVSLCVVMTSPLGTPRGRYDEYSS
jgi:hypothetical protein